LGGGEEENEDFWRGGLQVGREYGIIHAVIEEKVDVSVDEKELREAMGVAEKCRGG
jgi:hypothetical protein